MAYFVHDQLQVLLSQESAYETTDYLMRMKEEATAREIAQDEQEQQKVYIRSASDTNLTVNSKKHKRLDDFTTPSSSFVDEDEECPTHTDQCRRTEMKTCPSSSSSSVSVSDYTTTTGRSSSDSFNGRSSSSPPDTTNESTGTSQHNQINRNWRNQICKWAYEVVDHYDLKREVVSAAMNYLDRYLGSFDGIVGKNLFQLVSMTCLYLAIKLNEQDPLVMEGCRSSMETILQLSNGIFTLGEMETKERELLQILQWRVHPPTSQLFVGQFLLCTRRLSSSARTHFSSILMKETQKELHDIALFTVELSVMDYFFITYHNSEIAIAALLNAMEQAPSSTAVQLLHRDFLSFLHNILVGFDLQAPTFLAIRERLALIYAQANEDEIMEGDEAEADLKDTTTMKTEGTESPIPIPESPQVQRTIISPTSVVTPDTNEGTRGDIFQQQVQQHNMNNNKQQHQYSAEAFDKDSIMNDLFYDECH